DQDPVLDVPADSARQDHFLQVPSLLDQVLQLISMGDACDVLFDDLAVIQRLGHVVAGGSYQLDPTFIRAVIGTCAAERGQERMMDVDDPVRKPCDELS